MNIALHSLTIKDSNVCTDIRIAGETGYQGLEMIAWKLLRYVDAGYKAEDLLPLLDRCAVRVVSINDIERIERTDPLERQEMLAKAERLSAAAQVLHCPTIQLLPLTGLADRPFKEMLRLTARNVADIADIGKRHGVRFKVETSALSPIHSVSAGLQLLEEVGRDNVGLGIDTWHLYAGQETAPDDVAKLPGSLIYGFHLSDGLNRDEGGTWDENILRGFLPGDGRIPLKEWVDAVRATGYDGPCACEMVSYKHWEWDIEELARVLKERMTRYA